MSCNFACVVCYLILELLIPDTTNIILGTDVASTKTKKLHAVIGRSLRLQTKNHLFQV